MIKRFIALAVCLLTLAAVALPSATTAHAAGGATISVSADRTTVNIGEEVTFSVSLSEGELTLGSQFNMYIPDGLKYNSCSINEASKSALALDYADIDNNLLYMSVSSNQSRAPISGNTVLFTLKCTAERAGSFTVSVDKGKGIYVVAGDMKSYVSCQTTSATINVVIPVSGVTLSETSRTLREKGETFQLFATVSPDNASNKAYSFSSSNTGVAAVSADGTVTAVANGKASIIVTTADGGKTAVCEVTVDIPHKHTLTEVKAKESTCTETGNRAYYKCTGCGKVFKDKNAASETTVSAETIAKKAHKFDKKDTSEKYLASKADCQSPAKYHYCCSVCGTADTKTFESGNPDPNNHSDIVLKDEKKATEEEEGYSGDKFCNACGKEIEKGHVVPKFVHMESVQKIEAKQPTETEDGNIEYYICNGCGKIYKDAKGKTEIKLADTVLKATKKDNSSSKSDSSSSKSDSLTDSDIDSSDDDSALENSLTDSSAIVGSQAESGSHSSVVWIVVSVAAVLAAAAAVTVIILKKRRIF